MALEMRQPMINNTNIWNVPTHFAENAPRSANRASTPVKASRIPPRDFHPSLPFLTK